MQETGNDCALGVLFTAPSTTGTLTLCADGSDTGGYCNAIFQEQVPFSINLTEKELLLSVQ